MTHQQSKYNLMKVSDLKNEVYAKFPDIKKTYYTRKADLVAILEGSIIPEQHSKSQASNKTSQSKENKENKEKKDTTKESNEKSKSRTPGKTSQLKENKTKEINQDIPKEEDFPTGFVTDLRKVIYNYAREKDPSELTAEELISELEKYNIKVGLLMNQKSYTDIFRTYVKILRSEKLKLAPADRYFKAAIKQAVKRNTRLINPITFSDDTIEVIAAIRDYVGRYDQKYQEITIFNEYILSKILQFLEDLIKNPNSPVDKNLFYLAFYDALRENSLNIPDEIQNNMKKNFFPEIYQ